MTLPEDVSINLDVLKAELGIPDLLDRLAKVEADVAALAEPPVVPPVNPPVVVPPVDPPKPGVSRIAPATGCLTGMYLAGNAVADIAALETSSGAPFDVYKCYVDCATVGKDTFWNNLAARARAGKIIHVAFEMKFWGSAKVPSGWPTPANPPAYSMDEIASGKLDEALMAPLAARLKALPGVNLFDIRHEADIEGDDGHSKGNTPSAKGIASYKNMLKHTLDVFDAAGVGNVEHAQVWSAWQIKSKPELFQGLYLEDDRITWLGADPYDHVAPVGHPIELLRPFHDQIRVAKILGAKAATKPLMCGEYGVLPDPQRPRWLGELPAALAALPGYKCVQWFNSGGWGELKDAESIKALAAAYQAIKAAQK